MENGVLRCADCGLPYRDFGLDVALPDQQWRVIGPELGVLCATCICHRAAAHGATVVLAWIDNLNYEAEQGGEG